MTEAGRISEPTGRLFATPPVEGAIAALAVAQHNVFSLTQLQEIGISARAVQKRVVAARLHRIHPGVYSLVPRQLLTREGHWMAAVLACGPGAVLSHRRAAVLHGLRPSDRVKIDVTIPRSSRLVRPGIDVHRSRALTEADVTVVRGIPCTTVARTLFDLAEVVNRRALERAFDEAEVLEVFDLRAIDDQLARNPTRPAARIVRSLLDEHYIGSTPTQSALEEAFFAICRKLGVPQPRVSQWIDLGDGLPMIWADFVWREQRVIVETDGDKFHGTRQARERDPRRDQRATVAGWRPIRTTWRQVMRRPQELGPTLLRLVRQPPPAAPG